MNEEFDTDEVFIDKQNDYELQLNIHETLFGMIIGVENKLEKQLKEFQSANTHIRFYPYRRNVIILKLNLPPAEVCVLL